MKIKFSLISVLIIIAVTIVSGCASVDNGTSHTSNSSVSSMSFVEQAEEYEQEGAYQAVIAAISIAEVAGELSEEELDVEFTRLKKKLGENEFYEIALQASEFCLDQGDIADKKGNPVESMNWTMAAMNILYLMD